jgi:hypothetical protein
VWKNRIQIKDVHSSSIHSIFDGKALSFQIRTILSPFLLHTVFKHADHLPYSFDCSRNAELPADMSLNPHQYVRFESVDNAFRPFLSFLFSFVVRHRQSLNSDALRKGTHAKDIEIRPEENTNTMTDDRTFIIERDTMRIRTARGDNAFDVTLNIE